MSNYLLERTLKEMLIEPLADFAENKINHFQSIEFMNIDDFRLDNVFKQIYRNEVVSFSACATAVNVRNVRYRDVVFNGHIVNGDVIVESIEYNGKTIENIMFMQAYQKIELY